MLLSKKSVSALCTAMQGALTPEQRPLVAAIFWATATASRLAAGALDYLDRTHHILEKEFYFSGEALAQMCGQPLVARPAVSAIGK